MKTKEEILDKIIADEGLKFWEAHTDNFNRKIAMKAMDIFASQSLSSKIEEVREKVSEIVISEMAYKAAKGEFPYVISDHVLFENIKKYFAQGARETRNKIFSSLEGEKG